MDALSDDRANLVDFGELLDRRAAQRVDALEVIGQHAGHIGADVPDRQW